MEIWVRRWYFIFYIIFLLDIDDEVYKIIVVIMVEILASNIFDSAALILDEAPVPAATTPVPSPAIPLLQSS